MAKYLVDIVGEWVRKQDRQVFYFEDCAGLLPAVAEKSKSFCSYSPNRVLFIQIAVSSPAEVFKGKIPLKHQIKQILGISSECSTIIDVDSRKKAKTTDYAHTINFFARLKTVPEPDKLKKVKGIVDEIATKTTKSVK